MVRQTRERNGGVGHREDWNPVRYQALLDRFGAGADWAVVPDVVCDGHRTLTRTMAWIEAIRAHTVPLVCVADGIEPGDVWPILGPQCGIFVAGSTSWKWTTLPEWGRIARARGCYLHVGRVNSAKRIALCVEAGADSFDGRCVLFDRDRITEQTEAARNPSTQTTIYDMETS